MIINIRSSALIGNMIAGVRQATGLNQAALSAAAGIHQAQVSKYERSLVTPDVESTRKLLAAAGWQLCAVPVGTAATHDEREAVIDAARQWFIRDTSETGAAVIDAIVRLAEAEDSARLADPAAPPSPLEIIGALRADREDQREVIGRLRAQLEKIRRIVG